MDKESWQNGFDAGQRREANLPPEGVEVLSWHRGYIEGNTHDDRKNIDESGEKGV